MSCRSWRMGNREKTWAETQTKTGHIHDRLCTQVMYKATKEDVCRAVAIQARYARKGGRGSEGRETRREGMERKGTHNRLAAPVLMLRPAGPLADLAKAIVDRGAGSLLPYLYVSGLQPSCLPACLRALILVWREICETAELR